MILVGLFGSVILELLELIVHVLVLAKSVLSKYKRPSELRLPLMSLAEQAVPIVDDLVVEHTYSWAVSNVAFHPRLNRIHLERD